MLEASGFRGDSPLGPATSDMAGGQRGGGSEGGSRNEVGGQPAWAGGGWCGAATDSV